MNRFLVSALHLRRAAALALAAVMAFALAAAPLGAQMKGLVRQGNLDELVTHASLIFSGKILGVRSEPHPQYPKALTVVITVRVTDTLKGQPGTEYTFRSLVGGAVDFRSQFGYKPGEEVFLMLTRPSELGLSSPIGLDQGRFRVVTNEQGTRLLVNGYGNAGLFKGMDTSASKFDGLSAGQKLRIATHQSGPIAETELKDMIRALVTAGSQ